MDSDGVQVPAGTVGDLLIKGDSTCAYYWNRHDQTKATILGEWIRTGDKYRVEDDGQLIKPKAFVVLRTEVAAELSEAGRDLLAPCLHLASPCREAHQTSTTDC